MRHGKDSFKRRSLKGGTPEADGGSAHHSRGIAVAVGRRQLRFIALGLALLTMVAVLAVDSSGTNSPRALAMPAHARHAAAHPAKHSRAESRRGGIDFTQTRTVATAYGPAHVTPRDGGGLCVTVPDPAGGSGQSCATVQEVLRRGLVAGIMPRDGAPSSLVVVIPDGATIVARRADGTTSTLDDDNGLAATTVSPGDKVVLRIGDRELPLTPPLDVSHAQAFAACDQGARPVPIPEGMPVDQIHQLCDK